MPLFFRLLSNAFSDFGSVGRKNFPKKANTQNWKTSLGLGGPVPQHKSVEPENNNVWLQSQHGCNEGKINCVVRIK